MNIMPFVFQIRPLTLEEGFDLSCEGVLKESSRHGRLIEAVVRAVQLSHNLRAEIQIFDCDGRIAEVIPLPADAPRAAQAA
jgi:hypothetical protein